MRIRLNAGIGIVVFIAYAVWVMAAWAYYDIDYRQIADPSNLVHGVILPLSVAAIALGLFNTMARSWRETVFETSRLHRPAILLIVLLVISGFIAAMLTGADLASITPSHLVLIGTATALVGFCEEMVSRGILLVGLRGSLKSETQVWFYSSLLFGLLHASNAFFGLGAIALVQVVAAFCVGTGLYLLRRLTGTLLVPMLVHACWDFSTLAGHARHASVSDLTVALQLGTYLVCLAMVFLVLRVDGARGSARE